MNTRKFAEAMSMVDDKYYEEAANYQRGKKAAWRRWEAPAACLCVAAACVFAAHLWGMPGAPAPNPNGTIRRGPEPDQYPPTDIVPGFTLRHHYSEEHDFIEIDCGGMSLTVWLPGEANRFRVGDSVTVAYNGEPATVRNIWPGQLVSVE